MIARLHGTLAYKAPEGLIVDVGGVGYEVLVSLNSFYALPEEGGTVRLEIQTQVREDSFELFGFLSLLEKATFNLLQSVSGVGPRMALAVLSGVAADDLLDALAAGDLRRLVGVPGIGRKRAERLVVELKDKVGPLRQRFPGGASVRSRLEDEAVSALVNLGYKQGDAEHAIKDSLDAAAGDLGVLIRVALKRLTT